MNATDYIFLIKKTARRVSLRINSRGETVVTAPNHTPRSLADKLVAENQDWINRQKLRQQRLIPLITPTSIMIFGHSYQRATQVSAKLPAGYYVQNHTLIYNPVDSTHPARFQAEQLQRFLKSAAAEFIAEQTTKCAQLMQLHPKSIGLRQQTSRWGSCNTRGHLSFNWRLVHFAPAIIEYVIIHELAHLKHPNHSRQFWQTVAQYCPDYQTHRQTLKKYLLEDK